MLRGVFKTFETRCRFWVIPIDYEDLALTPDAGGELLFVELNDTPHILSEQVPFITKLEFVGAFLSLFSFLFLHRPSQCLLKHVYLFYLLRKGGYG